MTKHSISKYEASNKIVEIVKKGQLFDATQDMMKVSIELETGKSVSDSELAKYINMARQQIKEQQKEVEVYSEYMIRIGLFENLMKSEYVLSMLEKYNFARFLEEVNKKGDADINKMVNLSSVIIKIEAAKRNTIQDLGYLTKAKQIIENNNPDTLNKRTQIMLDDHEKSVEELVEQSTNKIDLEDNRVA